MRARKRDTGTLIAGRYRVETVLGRGVSSRLYRVTDTERGGELAFKRLASGTSARTAAQFELEYQILAGLKHPRIVEAFEFGRDGEGPFYTMALLAGESLSQVGPAPYREVCAYLRDAAEGLAILHRRRLLYRDVSPKNLWRTPDGRVLLSDFSALTSFGPAEQVAATPPYVPPEAVRGGALDQRADLYALGATAYYLLTGTHAYGAYDLRGLNALWAEPLRPPSERVASLELVELPRIPSALDALVLSLLSPDPSARPNSVDELLAQLAPLLEDLPAARTEPTAGEPAFVGRAHERRTLRRLLNLAHHGHGQSCVIEAAAGLGRTRILRELAGEAQAVSSLVLHVDASWCEGPLGVASALAERLLDVLPTASPEMSSQHAALLAQLSSQLRARLHVSAEPDSEGIERRLRTQNALIAWFGAIAAEMTMTVLVDGLELADDESVSVLLALARGAGARKLLIVATTRFGRLEGTTAAERALSKLARRIVLHPLAEDESFELMRSLFGEVEHLGRLAHQLHGVSQGNPDHLLELCSQMIRQGQIRFADGAWVLPREARSAQLSSTRDEAREARLSHLGPGARALGRMLSVHPESLSLEMARDVAACTDVDVFSHLGELLREGIVVREGNGLRFSHPRLRSSLHAELPPEKEKAVKRALARALLSNREVRVVDELRAGLYLLESGELEGREVFARASERLAVREYDALRHVLPELERGLSILRATAPHGGSVLMALAALSIAGYYVDFRYAARYADETIGRLSTYVGLPLAARLRPFLGRVLSLWIALIVTMMRPRREPGTPSVRTALVLLVNCVATSSGTYAICGDPETSARYARMLAPLTALGSNHLATVTYEFCSAIADTVRDAFGSTLARFRRIVARLESPRPIRGLPADLRNRYMAGALYATGSIEALRDGDDALRTAERLDRLELAFARLSADQVRTMYHAYQGNVALFERYRELAEQHAIQIGTEWQTELWSALRLINAFLAMQDAEGLARTTAALERIQSDVPSLAPSLARALGAQLVLTGRSVEAVPLLTPFLTQEPRNRSGWGTSLGILAMAHNALGDHEKARIAALRALTHLDLDDLSFPSMNLIVQCELAVAQAGLGELEEARSGLRALIALHHLNEGPLTMGRLYEAGMRIELLAGDTETARQHLEQAKRWYLPTGVPALALHCAALDRALAARLEGASVTG